MTIEKVEDKNVKGIFVMTASMKRLYSYYHDVIFLDSTCKTNKSDYPLVVIGGIDHNNKNIVLGFGFLRTEDNNSYKWFLSQLLKCTEGTEPGTILTDFDPAIAHAIEHTFKTTNHLLCEWHFMQNLKKQFIHLQNNKSASHKKIYDTILSLV